MTSEQLKAWRQRQRKKTLRNMPGIRPPAWPYIPSRKPLVDVAAWRKQLLESQRRDA